MCIVKIGFFLFYFHMVRFGNSIISVEQSSKIHRAIEQFVNVSQVSINDESVSPHIYNVSFCNEQKTNKCFSFNIYAHSLSVNKYEASMSKLNIFYVCASCMFAVWTKNWLFILIKKLPLFYYSKLMNSEHTNAIKIKFKKKYQIELLKILEFVNKFIRVLSILKNIEPHSVLSNETIVLQTLYVLKLKMYYFEIFYEDFSSLENTDDVFIRECLDIINAFQSFILTNCQEKDAPLSEESKRDKRKLFGYTISVVNFEHSSTKMLNALETIFNLNFELFNSCLVPQILLKVLIFKDSARTHALADETGNANIYLKNGKSISISKMFLRVSEKYDIEEIYFYMKSLMGIIMKLILSKTELLLSTTVEVTCAMKTFRDIQAFLTPEKYPSDIIDFFDYLVSASELPVSIIISKIRHDNREKYNHIELLNISNDVSLENFMQQISMIDDHLACFTELFHFLRSVLERPYIPLIANKNNRQFILPTLKQIITRDHNCGFIDSVYMLCLKIVVTLEYVNHVEMDKKERTKFMQKVSVYFGTLKKYFLTIVETKRIGNHNVLKIAYDAAIVLVNMKFEKEILHLENHYRTVYWLMTVLNGYGIAYCSTPPNRFGYMLYDNVKLFALLNLNKNGKMNTDTAKIIGIAPETFDELPRLDYDYLNLKKLYEEFVKKSLVFHTYENIIKFYWKGEKKSIAQFYSHVMSPIALNSRFLYAFYDLYFKFHIAAFYYEIDLLYQGYLKNQNSINLNYEKINVYKSKVARFSEENFPEFLRPFIIKLKMFALSLLNHVNLSPDNMKFLSKQFAQEIKEWHIEFESEAIKQSNPKECFLRGKNVSEFINLIIKAESTLNMFFNKYYVVLHKYDDDEIVV